MGSTSETDFAWVMELKTAFARSFPGDYQLVTLQRFQQCVEEEMQSSSYRRRLILLFETLLDFYSHFCWKIKFKKPSEIMKNGFIQLLANLIRIGLTVKYEARLRTVLTVLTDKEDLLYSALLLVTHLKKKSQESYGVLLGDILCSRPLRPSTPETYLKIMLLLRRLQLLTRKKPRQLASPPIHTISWLRLHCPQALPKNPKPHTLTNHLLQKKLPLDILKDLREVLLPFDDKPLSQSFEKIRNEEGIESRDDAFVIDSSVNPSSHQDLSQLFEETKVSKKKKRRSAMKEEESSEVGLKEKTHLEEFDKKVSQKESKKHNHLHEIEGSKEIEGSNLLNGVEVFELPECNTEETKSKKKRRKSRKEKDSTAELCDQVSEDPPFEEKIRNDEETEINEDVSILNELEGIKEESFEKETSNKEEMNVSSRKRRHKSGKGKSSPDSVTTEKDCNSLSSSKKRKMAKRTALSTSKEELNDQSCNLSILSDSVADNGNMNEPIESSCVSSESHSLAYSSKELLDHEYDASEEKAVHQSLKMKKNKKDFELQSSNSVETNSLIKSNKSNTEVSPNDIVQLAGECLEKDTVKENVLVQEKQGLKTPKKSRKSLLKDKNKNSKSQSDPVHEVEAKAANRMINTADEEQLLETSRIMKTKDLEVTNESLEKGSENSMPNLLGLKDFEIQNNDIKVSLECGTDNSTECESTNAKYKDKSVLENSVSVDNCEGKNLCESPRKNKFNSEKEETTEQEFLSTDESSDQKTNKLSSKDAEIKESIPKLTKESGDNHCDETDVPVVTQILSSLQKETDESMSVISLKEEDSAMEAACLGSCVHSPTNPIQKLKEECLSEVALYETSKGRDDRLANVSKKLDLGDSPKIENESEEIFESKIKGIRVSWRPSLEDSETILSDSIDPKEEDDVKSEEENYDEQVGIEGDRQEEGSVRRVRVYPQIIKKNEESDEESEQSILIKSSKCSAVESSDSKELIGAYTVTDVRNKVDHDGQNRSMCKSEPKNRLLNDQCSENSTNKVSVKSQSSDSEMSLKEAIINEYEELSENTETKNIQIPETSKSKLQSSICDVKSDSEESLTESLDLDINVEELSKNLMITSGKQMPKTKTYMKKSNDKYQSTTDSLCSDSDESISSLNLEEEESSSKPSALEKRSTGLSRNQSLSKKKIDVESKSLNPEHKSLESFCADQIVEEESINNKSNEGDPHFTPRKSKRLDIGKHSVSNSSKSSDMAKNPRKLLVSSPDSIKIQNVSGAVNDESNINSMAFSVDKNEGNPDSKAKSQVERKTRSRRMPGAEKALNVIKNCSVVLFDILGSAGEKLNIIKEELSTTDEEPTSKGFQARESSSKKDTDLRSPNQKTKWTLSYESDSSIESDDERDSDKRHKKGKISHSKNLPKTVKPSSDLNPVNELAKPSESEQDTEVGSRRYNLRRSCKTFPNVKQPSSQKLAAVPRMTFSPLIRKAADYPEFSDVSLSEDRLGSIQEEVFNDEYRESPADLTVIEPADKMEDETSSIGDESSSLPTEPETMSQPIVSKDNSEHISSENSSDVESSQGISENGNEASQTVKSENTSDPSPVKSSKSNSSSAEPILRISKSRLKASSSSRRQQSARGYSLRSKGAAVGLELNLEKLSIGTSQKKVNSREKDAKKDTKSEMPKETESADDHCNLRRSKRNVVLPGKLKL